MKQKIKFIGIHLIIVMMISTLITSCTGESSSTGTLNDTTNNIQSDSQVEEADNDTSTQPEQNDTVAQKEDNTKSETSVVQDVQPATVKITDPSQIDWNTSELDSSKNGNLLKATDFLNQISQTELESMESTDILMNDVVKKPWEYYGKFINIGAFVVGVTAYPPDSDISKTYNPNGIVTELMLTTGDLSANTSFLYLGDATNFNENDFIVVTGLPCGIFSKPNAQGVEYRYLIMTGATAPTLGEVY